MRRPPTRQRGFIRGFGWNFLQREQHIDPVRIERVQHEKRDPDIGPSLNPAPLRGEQGNEVEAEQKQQPRAHADNESLRAVVRASGRAIAPSNRFCNPPILITCRIQPC